MPISRSRQTTALLETDGQLTVPRWTAATTSVGPATANSVGVDNNEVTPGSNRSPEPSRPNKLAGFVVTASRSVHS
jgi:hypothetical protein